MDHIGGTIVATASMMMRIRILFFLSVVVFVSQWFIYRVESSWPSIGISVTVVRQGKPQQSAEEQTSIIYYNFPTTGIPDPVPQDRVLRAFAALNDREAALTAAQKVLGNCSVTSKLVLERRRGNESELEEVWTIRSYDINGQPKTVGGDDLYLTFITSSSAAAGNKKLEEKEENSSNKTTATSGTTTPTAVADITDLGNGSYRIDHFVIPPTAPHLDHSTGYSNATALATTNLLKKGEGRFELWLEQSCGLGKLSPPTKKSWKTNGMINQRYHVQVDDDIPIPKSMFKAFDYPNLQSKIDLGIHDKLILVGDSLMGNFAGLLKGDKGETFYSNMVKVGIWKPLNNQTLQTQFLPKTRQQIQKVLSKNKKNKNIGLVLGSGAWDLLAEENPKQEAAVGGGGGRGEISHDQEFENHIESCRQLITTIQKEFGPNITQIYWKSNTAFHALQTAAAAHKSYEEWSTLERLFYMSNRRSLMLYKLQKNLMHQLKIPFLDVYSASYYAAHMIKNGDSVHYTPEFNRMTIDWFYPNNPNNNPRG